MDINKLEKIFKDFNKIFTRAEELFGIFVIEDNYVKNSLLQN